MQLAIDQKDIDKFLMIGDKVLIKPKNPQSQTKTGLYLPPTVQQGEKIQAGYVIQAGPGYPNSGDFSQSGWQDRRRKKVPHGSRIAVTWGTFVWGVMCCPYSLQ